MKRFTLVFAAVVLAAASVFAAGVDENELRSVNRDIVFENYVGPHATVDTLDQIKDIGRGLGSSIAGNASTAGNSAKYYVIHAIDPSTKEKLDADILVLGANANVDHIRNLRHIIAGYLSSAYGYSEKDAQTIATFVTVYNAVYRKDLNTYKSKYKDVVTKNLTAEKCGLSTKYSDWPGNTQIVIPISDVKGGISTVDTSIISDKQVITSMKDDDDKNIDARKDMVDLKERESDKANEEAQEAAKKAAEDQKAADEEQKKADTEQKAADQEKKALEQKQKETQQAQKAADTAQKKADENPNDKKAQQDAKAAQTKANEAKKAENTQKKKTDDAQKKADTAQKKADDAQKKADESKKTANEKQAFADKKQTEAQDERKEIAKDQQSVESGASSSGSGSGSGVNGVYGLSLANKSNLDSTIVKVNTSDGTVMQKSEVNVIKNRVMFPDSNGFVAVAGENKGNGVVKLVLIDQKSLEIVKQSEETLSDNSVLVQDGSNYLVVIQDKGLYYVAKYDSNLKLVKKSPVPVSPNTPIAKTSMGYMVTDVAGQPLLLDSNELKITIKQAIDAGTNTVKNLAK